MAAATHPESDTVRGVIELPKVRTLKRWFSLVSARSSLSRALQEEAVDGLRLAGRVLDLGGDGRSGYRRRITVDGTLETVNLTAASRPDHVCDLEDPLPFATDSYDHVLCVNTLEHISRDVALIHETIRVLKPGGSFHFLVPFCHKVHGSPRDFHRHTADWWLQALADQACCEVRIEPLVWNRFSTAVGVMNGGRILRLVAMSLPDVRAAVTAARRAARNRITMKQSRSELVSDFALGYYIRGKKCGGHALMPAQRACP